MNSTGLISRTALNLLGDTAIKFKAGEIATKQILMKNAGIKDLAECTLVGVEKKSETPIAQPTPGNSAVD